MFQPTRIVMAHAPDRGVNRGQRGDGLILRVPQQ
jgi:hypothetical protein